MSCNSLVLLFRFFLILLSGSLQELDGVLNLLMFLNSSSSGSESLFEKLESSLIDFLDSHLEKLKDSLLKRWQLGDSVHEFSDLPDSVRSSSLSVHWSLFVIDLSNNESFVEAEGIAEYAVGGGLRHGIYKF